MPGTIIESALTGKLDPSLVIKWLNNEVLEDPPEDCVLLCCCRSEFAAHFLSYLRNQTDSILQTNSSALQVLQHQSTPEKLLSSRKHQRSISDPTYEADRSTDSLSVKPVRSTHESPCKDKKRTGRRVKTKLFTDDKSRESISSDDSRISAGVESMALSSTPMKNGLKLSEYSPMTSPVTPNPITPHSKSYDRCDTPRHSHRHSRSQEKTCLGDYLVSAQKSSKKKKSRNLSDDSDVTDLGLSNTDVFPEIGGRKSNSLKSEKRRIKPTNIDRSKKSLSLNSFTVDCFQPSSLVLEDNAAFNQQTQSKESADNFDAERNILKQERHKLMEKFNILNSTTSPKPPATPQIKISYRDSVEKQRSFIQIDSSKVVYKEKLDILIEIYDALLRNNLILSMNTEIYFLISLLLSKQYEDDYVDVESNINDNNFTKYLLKTVHNSTYFSVQSLWCLRGVLEVILDKNALKQLGENKNVRSFYPDLAKILLNCYGLKCEAESHQERRSAPEASPNGVICFNFETDNAENFPSAASFQSFKKQRDMFYEILRWYNECGPSGAPRAALRARVKALLWGGSGAAELAHLAGLLVRHMLAQCAPPASQQESRLSKLQRRLTRPAPRAPAAPPAPAAPHFAPHELFYKELLECADSATFRALARDALAAELCALHHSALPNTDTLREYTQLAKKLSLLGKFLGLVAALPYAARAQPGCKAVGGREPSAPVASARDSPYAPPKEKVLENSLASRNCTQPCIDIKGMLADAEETGRLCIVTPWLVQYLAMLDYTALRTLYYQQILKTLLNIYLNKLKISETPLRKNTAIYLKSSLGWLFTLPHFPQELFYDGEAPRSAATDSAVDSIDIDESALLELCPSLKEVNVLVSTSRVDGGREGSFRHITPVSLTLNPEERMRNKERELQSRLEEEFLKSQPASTRRVLELVTERVCACALREAARALQVSRGRARAAAALRVRRAGEHAALVEAVEAVYAEELRALRTSALAACSAAVRARAAHALHALLPAAPAPLRALTAARCRARLAKWLQDNWASTAILCKDIEAEVRTLQALGELSPAPCLSPAPPPSPCPSPSPCPAAMLASDEEFNRTNVSIAEALINLKEQICLLLEGAPTPALARALDACARACCARSLFRRAPAARAALQLSLDLCIVFVSKRPEEVSDAFLQQLGAVWDACCPAPRAGAGGTGGACEAGDSDNKQPPKLRIVVSGGGTPAAAPAPGDARGADDGGEGELFGRLLCPRNVELLSAAARPAAAWAALARVLRAALRGGHLAPDALTEQCLELYRQDWPQATLEHLSACMRRVSAQCAGAGGGKLALFLDFLAEYCGDMQLEPPQE